MLGFVSPRRLLAPLFLLSIAPVAVIQGQAPARPTGASPGNETLTYTVEWRMITAGTAKIDFNGQHLLLHLESAGLVSKLFRVEDVYNVSYDPGLCATAVHFEALEGRRKRDTRITFDRAHSRADYLEKDLIKNVTVKQTQIETPQCVHDVAGALIALRGMRIDVGHSAEMSVSDGKKVANVRIEAQEREQVKIKGAAVKTVRYEAFLFNNVIYARKARLFIWLTDDGRRAPVQIQLRMNFPVGTVTLTLDKEEHS